MTPDFARLTGHRAVELSAGAMPLARLDTGTVVLAKRGSGPDAVRAELAGLRWLADSRTVPVPEIHGSDADWLVIERIETGPPTGAAAERLGRGLAALHRSGAPAFGSSPPDGPVEAWIGSAPMRNVTGPSWPEWYAEHRVEPYLRRAVDNGLLARSQAAIIRQACDRLPGLAGPAEPPARLHGDLWSGNVLWGVDGRAWLIDPAAHGGHRETDLAMLHLFGCPQLDRILAGYQQVAPLATGWSARIGLHQLFPLLVHTVRFGGGYADRAVAAARSALG